MPMTIAAMTPPSIPYRSIELSGTTGVSGSTTAGPTDRAVAADEA